MEDVQSALKYLFGQTLQAMLEGDMENNLGYPQGEARSNPASGSRRNGHCLKSVRSGYGQVDIAVP
jgi:transposase-like protein